MYCRPVIHGRKMAVGKVCVWSIFIAKSYLLCYSDILGHWLSLVTQGWLAWKEEQAWESRLLYV